MPNPIEMTEEEQEIQSIAIELEEKYSDLLDLMGDIKELVEGIPVSFIRERARSYWLAHIEMALNDDHNWVGGSMATIEGTIDELKEEVGFGEDDDEG